MKNFGIYTIATIFLTSCVTNEGMNKANFSYDDYAQDFYYCAHLSGPPVPGVKPTTNKKEVETAKKCMLEKGYVLDNRLSRKEYIDRLEASRQYYKAKHPERYSI